MKRRNLVGGAVGGVTVALSVMLGGITGRAQSRPPTEGPAVDGSPAWFLQGSFPDPTGRTIVDASGHVTIPPRGGGPSAPPNAAAPASALAVDTPPCRRSPLCGNRLGRTRQSLQRVQWKQTMGYTFTYPYALPPGSAAFPPLRSTRRETCGPFSARTQGSRSCSSSTRITS